MKGPSVLALVLVLIAPALPASATTQDDGYGDSGVVGTIWGAGDDPWSTGTPQEEVAFQLERDQIQLAVDWMYANLPAEQIVALAAHLDLALGRAPPLPACDPFDGEDLVDCIREATCGLVHGACLTVGVCIGFRAKGPIQLSPSYGYGGPGVPFTIKIRAGVPIFTLGTTPSFGEYFAGVSGITSC